MSVFTRSFEIASSSATVLRNAKPLGQGVPQMPAGTHQLCITGPFDIRKVPFDSPV